MKSYLRSILIFPIVVTILANLAFLFGGVCAPWQWWCAIILTIAQAYICEDKKKALIANLLFVATLLVMWCGVVCCYDSTGCPDMPAYHLPMIRLLIHGWNPIYDIRAVEICETLSINLEDMRPLMVAFTPKPLAVFSAVAYTFVHDPFALTFPIVLLVGIGTSLIVFSILREKLGVVSAALFCALIILFAERNGVYQDEILFLSAVGLIFTMYKDMRDGTLSYFPLIACSFWMMSIKLPGFVAAGLFWAMFFLYKVWQERQNWVSCLKRFITIGCGVALLVGLVSVNPYITSLIEYKHPLYPFMTTDEEKFPSVDLTWDFKYASDDVDKMGKIGSFFNAFVSPRLTREYYKWKLNQKEFKPHRWPWDYVYEGNQRYTPTVLRERIYFLLSFAMLLFLPRSRWFALFGVFSILIFPVQYIGFLRYVQWLYALEFLALALFIEYLLEKTRNKKIVQLGVVFFLAYLALLPSLRTGFGLMQKSINKYREITSMPGEIFPCKTRPRPLLPDNVAYCSDRAPWHYNNALLLLKECNLNKLKTCTIVPDDGRLQTEYRPTPFGYYVPINENDVRPSDKLQRLRELGTALPYLLSRRFITAQ